MERSEMKIRFGFFALALLVASLAGSYPTGASQNFPDEQGETQPTDDTSEGKSMIRRLAMALSSGRAAMAPFHGSRIENSNYKSRLTPLISGMECSIDHIASYVSCYSSPIETEDEAVTLFTRLVDALQSSLPTGRWIGIKGLQTASVRSATYRDQNSSAHIDIDIITRLALGGRNAYVVSAFAWPH
jgi:hypothetical protein